MSDSSLCSDCQIGYHAPFERFTRVATVPDGPMFLQSCNTCGSLWQETLRDARRLTPAEAVAIFPGYTNHSTAHEA